MGEIFRLFCVVLGIVTCLNFLGSTTALGQADTQRMQELFGSLSPSSSGGDRLAELG
jgi:hypothetical protein